MYNTLKTMFRMVGIFLCSLLNAQSITTTFDYTNANLGSACNVFTGAIKISDYYHQSHAGGVDYVQGKGLSLSVIPQGQKGDAFVINYPFDPGNTYDISITTVEGDEAVYLNTSVVEGLGSFPTTSVTTCTPDEKVGQYQTRQYGILSEKVVSASKLHTIPSFSILGSASCPYMIIWIKGGAANLSLDYFYISKIEIKKTPLVSFTLPQTVGLTCGATSPQTFTVTNVHNTPNVTVYEWNLGSANNGWLYNGSPAGQFILTSTNTLELIPSCGSSLGNISAKVTAGGVNYNTNTTTVNMAVPAMAINGPGNLCSSGTYSISNLPCNASVAWSASPTGVVSVSGGSNATLSRITDGTVTLSATVTACGKITNLFKANIQVGAVPVTLSASQLDCDVVQFTVGGTNAASYTWNSAFGGTLFNGSATTATTSVGQINAISTGGNITVSTTNLCGQAVTALVDYWPFSRTIQYGSYLPLLPGDQLSVSIDPIPFAANYTWYINGEMVHQGQEATSFCTCYGGKDPVQCGYNTVTVEVETPCGTQSYYSEFEKGCYYGMLASNVTAYPNPAREQVTIQLKEVSQQSSGVKLKDIRYVRIIDKHGVVRKVAAYATGTKSFRFNLRGLPADIYSLEVTDGTNKTTLHISVLQ